MKGRDEDIAAIDRIWKEHVRASNGGALQDFALRILEWERSRHVPVPVVPGDLVPRREVFQIIRGGEDLETFVATLEAELGRRHQECNDGAATPSSILLAVLNAVAAAHNGLNIDVPQFLRDRGPVCTCDYQKSKGSTQWSCLIHGVKRL